MKTCSPHRVRGAVVLAFALLAAIAARPVAAAPSGQLTWAVHISLAVPSAPGAAGV